MVQRSAIDLVTAYGCRLAVHMYIVKGYNPKTIGTSEILEFIFSFFSTVLWLKKGYFLKVFFFYFSNLTLAVSIIDIEDRWEGQSAFAIGRRRFLHEFSKNSKDALTFLILRVRRIHSNHWLIAFDNPFSFKKQNKISSIKLFILFIIIFQIFCLSGRL